MIFEIKRSNVTPDNWSVGAVDYDSEGEMYIAIFTGFAAEQRAREYAHWKNSQENPSPWTDTISRQADLTP